MGETLTIPNLSAEEWAHEALAGVELLYTDLDGTLLGRGGSLLTDHTGAPSSTAAEAAARVNASGLGVSICSGRNRLQLAEISRLLGWDGFLAELGCVAVTSRRSAPEYAIGEWSPRDLIAGENPYEAIIRVGALDTLSSSFPSRIEEHTPHHLNREVTHVLRGNLNVEEARRLLMALALPVDIIDNGIIHPPKTTLDPDIDEVHAYHLVPAGVAKHTMIELDLERRGLVREAAASIGDSATDVDMASATALTALVANALDDKSVLAAAETHDNIVATDARNGAGWAEFADAWMAARNARLRS